MIIGVRHDVGGVSEEDPRHVAEDGQPDELGETRIDGHSARLWITQVRLHDREASARRGLRRPQPITIDVHAENRRALGHQAHRDRPADSRPCTRYERDRSEEHTSELQSLMRISYAVFCLKKKINKT